jgi:hypothetical protein
MEVHYSLNHAQPKKFRLGTADNVIFTADHMIIRVGNEFSGGASVVRVGEYVRGYPFRGNQPP